jgi:hypothetical protein
MDCMPRLRSVVRQGIIQNARATPAWPRFPQQLLASRCVPNFLRVKTEDANCFCSPEIIYDIFILSIVLRSREPLFAMEDSDTNDYVHNKRSRTISNLSQQQLQHKRDLDRKAQRALRQRTKSRIQELSDDIARLKASSSERETAMIDELQALREQNRQLKMRLEHISRLAANHDSSENGTEICTDEHSNEKEVEGGGLITSSRGNRPSEEDDGQPSSDFDATVEDVDNGTYVHKPGDVNLQVPQYPQEADQSHFHDIGSSPYKEVMSTSYAPASHMELVYAVVEENGESRNLVGTAPSGCVENTSIQQIGKGMVIPTLDCVSRQAHGTDQYLDGPRPIMGNEPQTSAISPESSTTTHTAYFSDCSSSARGVSSFLPRHLPATCPLDQILLDFLSSRRMLVAQGTHIETLLGPEQPSVAAMLNPELAPTAHPLSRVMAEVLSTFEGVRLQELVSFMYLMHRTMRVSGTQSTKRHILIH